MVRGLTRGRELAVESLRWALIGALGVACAGRSSKDGDPGQPAGGANGGTGALGGAGGSTAISGRGGEGSLDGGTGPFPDAGAGTGGSAGGGAAGDSGSGGGGGLGGGTLGGSGGDAGAGRGGSAGDTGGSAGNPPGGNGGSAGAFVNEVCKDAQPWSANADRCAEFVHRTSAAACVLPARTGTNAEGGAGGEPALPVGSTCATDADCATDAYCVRRGGLAIPITYECVPACTNDPECGTGALCLCEPFSRPSGSAVEFGVCVAAECKTDVDCAAGFLCVAPPFPGPCGVEPNHFACQTPNDTCPGQDNCDLSSDCTFTDGSYKCTYVGICGRPFLIEGEARRASCAARSDWLDQGFLPLETRELTPEIRRAIAEHFLDAGAMEHASIAAFARFSLELLALGAPSSLVQAATRAMAEETEHARLAYGLAARYSGRERGPAPLDITGALDQVELLDVVERTLLEGCIGETTAALEAAWAAEGATDPVVRDALRRIAEDETRHAALAFEFVAWAARRDAGVAALAERVFARARAEAELDDDAGAPGAPEAAALGEHGVLSLEVRRAARRAALNGVIPGAWAATHPQIPNIIHESDNTRASV